ncbi:MAG: hypothetical protein WA208_18615 [Thermoanaerobaculia bacterium]
MIETARNVALLAPVPRVYLDDGRLVAEREGRVAFGSRAWQVFRELDDLRAGLPVDVYIYASHDDAALVASWVARYVAHVESSGGAHPAGMRYRPPSTATHVSDNDGWWAVFWEVEDLRMLPRNDHIPVSHFTGFGKRKAYGKPFVPEGPILIEHP